LGHSVFSQLSAAVTSVQLVVMYLNFIKSVCQSIISHSNEHIPQFMEDKKRNVCAMATLKWNQK